MWKIDVFKSFEYYISYIYITERDNIDKDVDVLSVQGLRVFTCGWRSEDPNGEGTKDKYWKKERKKMRQTVRKKDK